MDRNGCPDMFQHHLTLDRLGFHECLIDKKRNVFLGPQPRQRLGGSRRDVGLL